MTPDVVLKLSIEQLITALNMKLSTECTKLQPAVLPVATYLAKVRFSEPNGNCQVLTG